MACPDELILDLWLAGALPSDEAASVGAHVGACAACGAAERAARVLDAELHLSLELNADELAYLSRLDLASTWRVSPAPAALAWSGRIALVGVVASFAAWLVAAPTFGLAIATAVQVGVGTVLVNAALGLVFSLGQGLIDLIRNPALGLTQPLLALLGAALLVWPRALFPQRSFLK